MVFPKAHKQTFDGIVVDAGTHVIICSEKNFMGDALVVLNGSVILNNVLFKEIKVNSLSEV